MKDVLAFLRMLENPRDEVSWYRILLLLPGIGDATARAAIDAMAQLGWDSRAFGRFAPPRARAAAHAALVALLDELRDAPSADEATVGADIARVRQLYDGILRENTTGASRGSPTSISSRRSPPVIRSRDVSGRHSRSSRRRPRRTSPVASDDERDALISEHRAHRERQGVGRRVPDLGGRRLVPMARAEQRRRELEEERRLMYVAMTRARNHLARTYPLNSYATRARRRLFDRPDCRASSIAAYARRMERVVPRMPALRVAPEPVSAAPADRPARVASRPVRRLTARPT